MGNITQNEDNVIRFLTIIRSSLERALKTAELEDEAEEVLQRLRETLTEYGEEVHDGEGARLGTQLFASISVSLELLLIYKSDKYERARSVEDLLDSLPPLGSKET